MMLPSESSGSVIVTFQSETRRIRIAQVKYCSVTIKARCLEESVALFMLSNPSRKERIAQCITIEQPMGKSY
ncbi:MAG: hypothetical protein EA367_21355 [Leptolyngbya sp. DLM2.Bin15]|nr:MAG: hypothetical protein EA367_21355 [Leptolyngbya sp. DLM2.Bin15]